VQKLFDACLNKLSTDDDIIKLINQMNNVNVTKNINNVIHNPLTCYVLYQDRISHLVLLEFIEKNIDLRYKTTTITSGTIRNEFSYWVNGMTSYEIYIIKSTNNDLNITLTLLPLGFKPNQNHLLIKYLNYNNNVTIEMINYLIESGENIFNNMFFKNKVMHNALSSYLNNKNIQVEIVKKLVEHKELGNHIITINKEIYNMVTYYIVNLIKNKTRIDPDILSILLDNKCCSFIVSSKLDNYKHNALLLYLKKSELSVETLENLHKIIDVLMNNEHINPETVLYKNDRVYNILTWYLTNIRNPRIEVIDQLLIKNVNINFIDNRSNNVSELYLLYGKRIKLKILKYLYEKKVKFNEYCLSYYFQNIKNPEDYQEKIVSYLLEICELCDHNCWINVDDGGLYNTLSLFFPHLEQVQIIGNNDMSNKSYFRLYCHLS